MALLRLWVVTTVAIICKPTLFYVHAISNEGVDILHQRNIEKILSWSVGSSQYWF